MTNGTIAVNGGTGGGSKGATKGGNGGTGSISIGSIATGTYVSEYSNY